MKDRKNAWKEAAVYLILLAAALSILYPMLGSFSSRIPYAKNTDIRLSLSILFSNLKTIAAMDPGQIYHLPLVFPHSYVMTMGVNLFGQTLILTPFYLAGLRNACFLYNLLVLLAYLAAGIGAFLFIRAICGSRLAATVAASLFLLISSRVHNIPQLNLLFHFPIPFAFLFLWRYLQAERKRDLAAFTLFLFMQFLFDLSLGVFLAICLGLFFLTYLAFFGRSRRPSFYIWPGIAALCFFALTVAFFMPYLKKGVSFSWIEGAVTIDRGAFHSSLSFFSQWSTLLLKLKALVWRAEPHAFGLVASFLFLFAFWPSLSARRERIFFEFTAFCLLAPMVLFPLLNHAIPGIALETFADIVLAFFLAGFFTLLLAIRRRLSRGLFLISFTWVLVLFFSSQFGSHFGNLFQLIAKVIPFLRRSRGIRTETVIALLFLTVFAIGLKSVVERLSCRRILVAGLLGLLLAESVRWPVKMQRLEDDRPEYCAFYGGLRDFPKGFGLLELPLYAPHLNHYTLYTRYHDQHSTDGLIGYLSTPMPLRVNDAWQAHSGFSGLVDPGAVAFLRNSGIRYILLFKNRISSELRQDRANWHATQMNIALGTSLGLFTIARTSREGILLVLEERETGSDIRRSLPYYLLRRHRGLRFTLVCPVSANASILFNGETVETLSLEPGKKREVEIAIQTASLWPQINELSIRGSQPLTFDFLEFK